MLAINSSTPPRRHIISPPFTPAATAPRCATGPRRDAPLGLGAAIGGRRPRIRIYISIFAQARDAEAASEEFLVDDGWKVVEVEPEAAPANGNGHHADAIGPTVELALGNGHHPNGNGHGNGHCSRRGQWQRPQRRGPGAACLAGRQAAVAVLLGRVHG